jgi:hypothetical protein
LHAYLRVRRVVASLIILHPSIRHQSIHTSFAPGCVRICACAGWFIIAISVSCPCISEPFD